MVDETSAGLNPERYVAGLARAALRAGACLYDHTRFTSVEPERNKNAHKFRVHTSRGVITAREIILASGAYTTGATPALRKKIIPIGSYIIATETLPADLARELSPRNRMIYDSKHFLYYYRLTPDNRMLFGGRAAFFPETENTVRRSAEILRLGMIGVYPQLRDTKIEFVWGGTLDFTLDVMPHAGKIDGMYFAAGFAGHGAAPRNAEGPRQFRPHSAQLPRGKHRQNRHADAQPHIHGQELNHRFLCQQCIDDGRHDDGDPRCTVTRMPRRKCGWQIPILRH